MQNFTRESILQAIEKIDSDPSLRNGRGSIEYDLLFNDRSYPPILVLSEANKLQGGTELKLSDFGNSTSVPFNILREKGFTVNKKEKGFYYELRKFIEQSKTNDLTTSQYLREYSGLKVKVSFGQGYPARIPWIAFLDRNNSVSDGIYPVYLLFKSRNLLILAYGISETNAPGKDWQIDSKQTISAFFSKNGLGTPERYGDSYVFKSYNIAAPLNESEINNDLNDIVEVYKRSLKDTNTPKVKDVALPEERRTVGFNYKLFFEALDEANLFFNPELTLRFISSLLTKPFVILTGLSGSGKTKLAQAFSKWITENENQICIVPVGADWTNREPLLGFPNALESGKYILPDNGALQLILEASKSENSNKPFFLILDEMNLSHVERYFADFLSAMESGETIPLHSETKEWENQSVPSKIKLPKNLFLIGTVNVDETTYMFSPKVLDRASVIEFRVTADEMSSYLSNTKGARLDMVSSLGSNMSQSFVQLANNPQVTFDNKEELSNSLLLFFQELKKAGAEFGYRTAYEILKFGVIVNTIEPNWTIDQITDAAIMQKLLPKVHGSRRKLEPILKIIGGLCLDDGQTFDEAYSLTTSNNISEKAKVKFPTSFEKVIRMYKGLLDNGFTSYAEA
jgi:5-methylcytosine-specific restriction enzyme B